MKYKGKKLEGLNTDVLVLMKGEERIVFKASAVANYKEFQELCSVPEPPIKILPGGIRENNTSDPAFKAKLNEYAQKKTDYTVVKSLQASDDIEWDNVDIEKPETWKNWRTELEEASFTEVEVLRILQLCTRVNALDDDLLQQARESFLAETLLPGE